MSISQTQYRKANFILQDSTDNTKQTTLDLSNLATSSTTNLIVSNLSNGLIRISARDNYRLIAALTSVQSAPSNTWVALDLKTTGFSGAADPSGAWDDTNNRYVVQKSGLYAITLNVALNAGGGSDKVGALCGVVVGEATGTNNAILYGARRESTSNRDYVNCCVQQIYLNASEVIIPYGHSKNISRSFLDDSTDGPNDGISLRTHMTVRYIGDI